VVLIWTKDGALGSGSLLKDNTILTNRHVVGDEREVTVIFKPSDPSGKAKNDEVVQADVIKLDALVIWLSCAQHQFHLVAR
jgi:S1-C subfamily serine protease